LLTTCLHKYYKKCNIYRNIFVWSKILILINAFYFICSLQRKENDDGYDNNKAIEYDFTDENANALDDDDDSNDDINDADDADDEADDDVV